MVGQKTITNEEHYLLVDYYQNLIKKKDKEIESIKNNLQFTLQRKDSQELRTQALEAQIDLLRYNNRFNG